MLPNQDKSTLNLSPGTQCRREQSPLYTVNANTRTFALEDTRIMQNQPFTNHSPSYRRSQGTHRQTMPPSCNGRVRLAKWHQHKGEQTTIPRISPRSQLLSITDTTPLVAGTSATDSSSSSPAPTRTSSAQRNFDRITIPVQNVEQRLIEPVALVTAPTRTWARSHMPVNPGARNGVGKKF